ncbi:unnamed protein product, partial [Prorocentrum cordatum]
LPLPCLLAPAFLLRRESARLLRGASSGRPQGDTLPGFKKAMRAANLRGLLSDAAGQEEEEEEEEEEKMTRPRTRMRGRSWRNPQTPVCIGAASHRGAVQENGAEFRCDARWRGQGAAMQRRSHSNSARSAARQRCVPRESDLLPYPRFGEDEEKEGPG